MSLTVEDLRETLIFSPATRERFVPPSLLARALPGALLAGVSRLAPPSRTVRERPVYAVVMATLEGSFQLITREGEQEIGAGSLTLLPAHEPHGYWPAGSEPWLVAWLHLEAVYAQSLGLAVTPKVRQHPDLAEDLSMLLSVASRASVWELELAAQSDASGGANSPHVLGAVRAIDPLLHAIAGTEGVEELAGIEQRLWDSLEAPWTVEKMAQLAGCSPSQLHRRVRRGKNASPIEWLTRLRMQRAHQLLAGRGESVKSAAAQVGYANEFAFSVAFKRYFGKPPSEARARPSR